VPESSTDDVEQRLARLEQRDQRLTRALELLAEREAAPARKRRRDWDALAAVIASLIGLLALAVSGYTAYVQRQQLRAQVWPRLEIETNDNDSELAWHVLNQGTGPARVMAMRVVVDGAPVATWGGVMKAVGKSDEAGVIMSWISRSVLPAGKDVAIIRSADDPQSRARFRELLPDGKHRLRVTLCYCSVLDDCWVATDSVRARIEPGPPDDCPIPAGERFTQ
jgi:hypothetical protein